jgi:hypothetical protein
MLPPGACAGAALVAEMTNFTSQQIRRAGGRQVLPVGSSCRQILPGAPRCRSLPLHLTSLSRRRFSEWHGACDSASCRAERRARRQVAAATEPSK